MMLWIDTNQISPSIYPRLDVLWNWPTVITNFFPPVRAWVRTIIRLLTEQEILLRRSCLTWGPSRILLLRLWPATSTNGSSWWRLLLVICSSSPIILKRTSIFPCAFPLSIVTWFYLLSCICDCDWIIVGIWSTDTITTSSSLHLRARSLLR